MNATAARPGRKVKPPPAVGAAVEDRSDRFAAAVEAAANAEPDLEFRAALLALVEADRRERDGA